RRRSLLRRDRRPQPRRERRDRAGVNRRLHRPARAPLAKLLASGRVQVSARARSPQPRIRSSALLANAGDHRSRDEEQPAPRSRDVLTNELKKNPPRFLRDQTHQYLTYLDRHGSLAKRFCNAATHAWVVYGERDDVRITADERALLEATPGIRL